MATPVFSGFVSSATGVVQAFPVGAVFISVVSTNPATLLGYGTWSAIGAGRVLVGVDSGDTDFDTAEETGGAKTVASSAQTFTGNALGTHTHSFTPAGTIASSAQTNAVTTAGTTPVNTTAARVFVGDAGTTGATSGGTPSGTNTPGAATSVVQPYLCVYMWKRTA